MTPPEANFVPDDPDLYGPDPGIAKRNRRPLRDLLGLSAVQLGLVVAIATLVFILLGGPLWSAPRGTFPLRLLASYLIIPALVAVCLWWNRRLSVESALEASLAAGAIKFALTVVIDVLHGLFQHWPP